MFCKPCINGFQIRFHRARCRPCTCIHGKTFDQNLAELLRRIEIELLSGETIDFCFRAFDCFIHLRSQAQKVFRVQSLRSILQTHEWIKHIIVIFARRLVFNIITIGYHRYLVRSDCVCAGIFICILCRNVLKCCRVAQCFGKRFRRPPHVVLFTVVYDTSICKNIRMLVLDSEIIDASLTTIRNFNEFHAKVPLSVRSRFSESLRQISSRVA